MRQGNRSVSLRARFVSHAHGGDRIKPWTVSRFAFRFRLVNIWAQNVLQLSSTRSPRSRYFRQSEIFEEHMGKRGKVMLHEVILSAINHISTGGREQGRREASEMISS